MRVEKQNGPLGPVNAYSLAVGVVNCETVSVIV